MIGPQNHPSKDFNFETVMKLTKTRFPKMISINPHMTSNDMFVILSPFDELVPIRIVLDTNYLGRKK